MGLTERSAEQKIPARKRASGSGGKELAAAKSWCTLRSALLKAPFHVVKGTAPPLAATQSYNVLHPWERYC